jgi:hypothetical protein
MRPLVFSIVLLCLCWASAQAGEQASPTPVPIVIELFTSEGCSSCPPADLLLQKLDRNQPIAGAQLIVLSEHVTYWDQDGWKDPNSSSALTERQESYEAALGSPTAYTPQMIVDGTHELHLRDARETEDVLKKASRMPKLAVRIGAVAPDPTNSAIRARIESEANTAKSADVYVAIALDHVESQVLRGENGGRHLVHIAVVTQLTKIGKLEKGRALGQDVEFKFKPGTDPKNLRLIAFVQERGPGQVLGAAVWKPAQ